MIMARALSNRAAPTVRPPSRLRNAGPSQIRRDQVDQGDNHFDQFVSPGIYHLYTPSAIRWYAVTSVLQEVETRTVAFEERAGMMTAAFIFGGEC